VGTADEDCCAFSASASACAFSTNSLTSESREVESTWQHRLFGLPDYAFLDHPDKPGGIGAGVCEFNF